LTSGDVGKMDALGLGPSQSNIACNSVQDLQGHLHHLLAAKTTDTRAEHTSTNFELLSHAAFYLVSESDNGALASTGAGTEPNSSPATRTVIASDTVQNQPADDPALQKTVAKHLTSAIGVVDHSTWTVREVTRGVQGWQFTYICKDSLQAWNRANAKNTERPVIASYSNGNGFDPINLCKQKHLLFHLVPPTALGGLGTDCIYSPPRVRLPGDPLDRILQVQSKHHSEIRAYTAS
jgi:hypothetical protein